MDFARKQLEKYGWKEGKGLGRNEDGIAAALKPKLKFDAAGVGHDYGAQFTNHWWETLFNNAAQNIDVQVEEEKVHLALNAEPIEITTKNYSTKVKDKNAVYGSFLKTSKLTSKGVESYKVAVSNIPTKFAALTDEELFAACGGRTAHKGARHGLSLSGKLSRIEKQEKALLKKMKGVSLEDDVKTVKKMKKLKHHKERMLNEDTNDSVEPVSDSSINSIKKTKKKCRKSVTFNDTVIKYIIPPLDIDNDSVEFNDALIGEEQNSTNADEGIERDIGDNNNPEDDNRSFEEAQFIVSDLSNAERKKLKKKRKLGKSKTSTIQIVEDESMDANSSNDNCECKKRKLSCLASPAKLRRKNHDKKRSHKDKIGIKLHKKKSDDQNMKNIVQSLDSFCKISDEL